MGASQVAEMPVCWRPILRSMVTRKRHRDHRVVDGARAAEFLGELTGAIREPEKWL